MKNYSPHIEFLFAIFFEINIWYQNSIKGLKIKEAAAFTYNNKIHGIRKWKWLCAIGNSSL